MLSTGSQLEWNIEYSFCVSINTSISIASNFECLTLFVHLPFPSKTTHPLINPIDVLEPPRPCLAFHYTYLQPSTHQHLFQPAASMIDPKRCSEQDNVPHESSNHAIMIMYLINHAELCRCCHRSNPLVKTHPLLPLRACKHQFLSSASTWEGSKLVKTCMSVSSEWFEACSRAMVVTSWF